MANKIQKKSEAGEKVGFGCLTAFLGIIAFAIMCILSVNVLQCAVFTLVCVILCEAIYFYFKHDVFGVNELQTLLDREIQNYCAKHYTFYKFDARVNKKFKTSISADGQWYRIFEEIDTFPSYVAQLLKGKHHEWVVIAIEKDGYIRYMWANKGENSTEVSFSCDLNRVIELCKSIDGDAVFRLHNHPNPDPVHYTTLVASEQDKRSAESCSDIVCKNGINWFDFVCAQGDYILFYKKIASSYRPKEVAMSEYADKIGISPFLDYKIHQQYFKGAVDKKRRERVLVFAVVGIALSLLIGVVDYNVRDKIQDAYLGVNSISEADYINPSEEYICNILNGIDDVIITKQARGEELKGGYYICSSIVEFSYGNVEDAGEIEVFLDEETASHRVANMRFINFEKVYQIGSVVFQTSKKLSSQERNLIIRAFVDNPPSALEVGTTTKEDIVNEIWNTPNLTDFKYEIYEEQEIILKEYLGNSKYIIVPSQFDRNGQIYHVRELTETFVENENIRGLILSEGITKVDSRAILDCSNIEYLYFPSTLTEGYHLWDLKNIDNDRWGKIIFFGSSYDELMNTFSGNIEKHTSYFDDIVYEATVDDCKESIAE